MAIRLPLSARLSSWLALRRSFPSNRISPDTIRAGGMSSKFITAEAETDLPEPLSPRTARVSPRLIDQLTLRTACTVPRAVWKSTDSLRTSSRASAICRAALGATRLEPPALCGVQRHAHPVRQEVERKGGDDDHQAGPKCQPPGRGQIRSALADHQPPGDVGRLNADAEKRQGGFRQHDESEVERGDCHQRRRHDRKNMTKDDAGM